MSLGRFGMLVYDKTSRMMKVGAEKTTSVVVVFKQSPKLEIIPLPQTPLGSTFCVRRNNFDGLDKVRWKRVQTSRFHSMGMASKQTCETCFPWTCQTACRRQPIREVFRESYAAMNATRYFQSRISPLDTCKCAEPINSLNVRWVHAEWPCEKIELK